MASVGGLERSVWRLVAFLGRYGHQPADVVLSMPVTHARKLAREVERLIKQENEANGGMQENLAGGGG